MFYRLVRAIVAAALGLFYRLELVRRVADLSGPVMFVGNHPNSLIDPALVFVITDRPVTFLAREPLFRIPVLGWVLKGLGALRVFRKQDHAGLTEKNEGTLETAAAALCAGKAITIFPEGRSHSDPQLSDIKTGCARIALRVAKRGIALRIVPIGLTYAQKHRFHSRVLIEVGEPLLVQSLADGGDEVAWVQALTKRVAEALRSLTMNLETWEDLDLVETADQLFALRNGYRENDPERLRLMAKGAGLLRSIDSDRFDDLKEDILSFRARLDMVRADPKDLSIHFQRRSLGRFVLRSMAAALLGFPLFALGLVLFALPFLTLKALAAVAPVSQDRTATLKVVSALVMVPVWWVLLVMTGYGAAGIFGLLLALFGALPLAIFTRYFLERRKAAWGDLLTFLKLGNRDALRAHLLSEGERLQEEIQRLVDELGPRVSQGKTTSFS